jgi:hypothetical protein
MANAFTDGRGCRTWKMKRKKRKRQTSCFRNDGQNYVGAAEAEEECLPVQSDEHPCTLGTHKHALCICDGFEYARPTLFLICHDAVLCEL